MRNSQQSDKAPVADGKRRLLDAALRLAGRDGITLSALGTRELAREAGLNHNTLYRHFRDTGELGPAVAEEVAAQIMAGMKEVRRKSQKHADATLGAVKYFLDFVRDNPYVFIVGLRELHSASTPMRAILLRVLDSIALESVEQIVSMDLVPGLDREALRRVTLDIAYYMFYRALDLIETPAQRAVISEQMVDYIRLQFFGALARRARSPSAPG
jgi:TetR/AcrR family transcriptional regulator, fatty acid biosynthesis regulator